MNPSVTFPSVVLLLAIVGCGHARAPTGEHSVRVIHAACEAKRTGPNPTTSCRYVEPNQFARLLTTIPLRHDHGRPPYAQRSRQVEEFEEANGGSLYPARWSSALAKQLADKVDHRAALLDPRTIAWVLVTTTTLVPEVVDDSNCDEWRAQGQACDPVAKETGRMVEHEARALLLFWRHSSSSGEVIGYQP